jgi:hypothetical protein
MMYVCASTSFVHALVHTTRGELTLDVCVVAVAQAEQGINHNDEYQRILSLRGTCKPSVQESLSSSAVKTAQERESHPTIC